MTVKVLHLIDSGGLYGAEVMLLNLVEEQTRAGLKPLILSAGAPDVKDKPLEIEARRRGLHIKIIRMKAGVNLIKAFQIIIFAKREGFEILHSHGYKFNILLGMIPRFVRKIPLVTTLHGYTSANGFSLIRVYQMMERILLKYLDGIAFVSGEIRNNPVLKGFKAKNEVVIFNGVNALKIISAASGTNAISIKDVFPDEKDDCIYIGAIGRLSLEKGFGLLVDVFARLVAEMPELRLVIIGEGELRSQLEEKIEQLNLAEKIRLPGFINPSFKLMAELDGVVMPSYTEGLPMTILEACVLKKPIVASDVGSIAEVLHDYDASIVVSPGDSKNLEAAIRKLIINGVGELIDTENWPIERFSSANMCKQYSEFYGNVVQGIAAQ